MVLFPPTPSISGERGAGISRDVHSPPTGRSRSGPANRPVPASLASPLAPCVVFMLGHPDSEGSRLV